MQSTKQYMRNMIDNMCVSLNIDKCAYLKSLDQLSFHWCLNLYSHFPASRHLLCVLTKCYFRVVYTVGRAIQQSLYTIVQ